MARKPKKAKPLPKRVAGVQRSKHLKLRALIGTFKKDNRRYVHVLPGGELLTTAALSPSVELYDRSLSVQRTVDHRFPFAVGPDGKMLVSDGHAEEHEEPVSLWHAGERLSSFRVPINGIYEMRGLLTRRYAVFPNRVHEILVYDPGAGRELRRLTGHRKGRRDFSIEVAPLGNGARAISSDGHTFRFWDLDTGKLEREVAGPEGVEWRELAISPDEQHAAVTAVSEARWTVGPRLILVISLADGAVVTELSGHERFVRVPVYLKDGRLLATASSDGPVRLWSTHDWQCVDELTLASSKDCPVRFHPLPDGALALTGERGVVYVWELTWPDG